VAGDTQRLRRLSEGAGRAGGEPMGASQDLAFGVVYRAHGEGGASSSGEKHTPIVAPDVTEAAGSGEGVAKASGIA
jgi:hypothetical protein